MNRRSIYILALTAAVIITSLSPFLDGEGRTLSADTASGERWINPFIDKIEQKDIVPEGYIGIWNENDLLKIGTNDTYDKDPSLTWSLDAQYIQMANIDLDGKNLNDGIKVYMELIVTSNILMIILTDDSDDPIENVDVWVNGKRMITDSAGSASFLYDDTNEYAVMCGGIVGAEPLAIAYTVPANYSGSTGKMEFDSNGNIDPIGFDSASGLTGHYDGNGYKVIGAEIAVFYNGTNTYANVGLFSSLNYNASVIGKSGWIENLGMDGGSTVLVILPDKSYLCGVGGIVGYMGYNTNIYNCYNSNTLYSTAGNTYIGGIVGRNLSFAGSSTYVWIQSCFNTGNITSYANDYQYGILDAGGIAGWCEGILYKTYNTGDIRIVNLTSNNNMIGGIVGYNLYWSMHFSQNSGKLSSLTTGRFTEMGGVAASAPAVIDCFNEGSMEMISQRPATVPPNTDGYPPERIMAGGLIGSGGYSRNSYNLGSMDVTYIPGTDKEIYIGGIVGIISYFGENNTVVSYFLKDNMTLNGELVPDPIVGGNYVDRYHSIDQGLDPVPFGIQATGPRDIDDFKDQSTFYLGKTINSQSVRGYVFIGDDEEPTWGMFSDVTSGLPFLVDLVSIDILGSPSDVSVSMSDTASFSVDAGSAFTLKYQWQVSSDGGTTWTNIPGAVASTYEITTLNETMDGNLYRCLVHNERGALISGEASLTLFVDPGSDISKQIFSLNLWFLYVIMLITFISAVVLWYMHRDDDDEQNNTGDEN